MTSANDRKKMNLLPKTMRQLRNAITTIILAFISLVVLTGQASATNGVHTFASPGTASGGFKPVGNHFLVSEKFEPDLAPNDTAICYNTLGLLTPAPQTVNGMIIKADGTNLTSFDLTDMKVTIYADSGGPEDISSLKITGTKVGGSTVFITLNPPSTAAGASFTLTGIGANLSAFTGITQLSFDITTANDVWFIDFSSITTANEAYPTTVAPTNQATNAQAVVVGSTEFNIGWTSGNGSSRVVFAKTGVTTGAPTLADSTTYAANGNFSLAADPDSDGWKCVYNGNSNFATITGLSATTQYRFIVFEYNGSTGREGYLTTGATNAFNQTTGGSLGVWTRGDIAGLDGTINKDFWTRTDADRDASGNIYVGHRYSYYNDTNAQLRIEKWDGASWSNLSTITALSAGYSGFSDYASTAVTGVNQVRLAITGSQAATAIITEAKYNGAWSFSDIDSTSTVNTSLNQPVIAVDGAGASHVLYEYSDANTGSRNQYIKLASWNGSAWSRQTLVTVPNPDSSNEVKKDYLLLNDANNKQHVFYFRQTAGLTDLHYWTNKSGSGVDTTIFTNSSETPYRLYGAFDSSGKLHIAYGLNTLFGKKVVYSSEASGWASQQLMESTAGSETGFTPLELRINSSGAIVIPVRSRNDKVFKALLKQGSNPWQVSTLSPVDAGTDDWEDLMFSNNNWGAAFRDDGKLLIAYANVPLVRPRILKYIMVSLTPPTVTGISPTSGPTAGGTAVTISGTGFDNGATVTIGGAAATGVTRNSATSISATTPAGSAGAKNIVVTNPDTQTGTLTNGFTYIANVTPVFVGATTSLTVNQNAPATDIKGLLHVSDPDASQTETWSQSVAPSHGTLSFSSATASSGSADITPGGTITYQPTAGYSGSDSFTVQVSDGIATATRTITVTVNPIYTVTYDGNGNTGGSAPSDGSSPYVTGSTVSVLGNTGSLLRTGYTFSGWNTAANGSGTSYAAGATFTIAANTTLFAKWLAIPVATAATGATASGFTANWGSAAGATGYYLDVAADSSFTGMVSSYNNKDLGNVTSAAVSNLAPGTTYYYRLRSYNGSVTSADSNSISAATKSGRVSAMVIDPAAPATLFAVVDGGGVFTSANAGGSWSATTGQPTSNRLQGLVLVPGSPSTLFAASYGSGLYSSTDSGASWNSCANTGLGGSSLNLLTLASDSSGKLYAGTEGGIFTSPDCGSWSALNTGLTVDAAKPAVAIAIDPANVAKLYAGLDGAGVYRSLNSGGNWSAAVTQPTNQRVKALVIKPGDGTKLFAATYGNGVFTSTDSGDHWTSCSNTGLTNLNLLSLTSDGSGKLYAGSEAGVFVSNDNCTTWAAINGGLP